MPESRDVHGLRHRQLTVSTIVFALLLASKSNEIPAALTVLERLELDGNIALMDALHSHPEVETARTVMQGGGGDYVLIINDNSYPVSILS